MSIRTKLNVTLFILFATSLGGTGPILYEQLQKHARDGVIETASVMMKAALSMGSYTAKQVKPLLEMQLKRTFLPQTIPSYATTEMFTTLRDSHPEYTYKAATLNPTNPRDRTTDWEAEIVRAFSIDADQKEIVTERNTPTGRVLYLAQPIRISDNACLECHSVPAAAPRTLRRLYGDSNGFGWKLDNTVGAQIVSVPMSMPIEKARVTFYTLMAALTGVFVFLGIILNVMLSVLVTRPLARVSNFANELSQGNLELPELPETGKDEVSVLTRSVNRVRRSLETAIKMIEK